MPVLQDIFAAGDTTLESIGSFDALIIDPTGNVFCKTGKGGGIDPGCAKGKPGSQMDPKVVTKLKEFGMVGSLPSADVPLPGIRVADLHLGKEALTFKELLSWKQTTHTGRESSNYRYTQAFHDRNAAEKHDRVASIEPHIKAIEKQLETTMRDQRLTSRQREAAAIANVIRETGLRPTDSDESVAHGHFGISSIQVQHVTVKGDVLHLNFVGKEGVVNKTTVRDPANVSFIKAAIDGAGKKAKASVFSEANSADARDALKAASAHAGGPEDIKIKDLRTLKAHQVAAREIAAFKGPPPPLTGDPKKDAKSLAKAILTIATKVAIVLNNEPKESRDTYVHPDLWKKFQQRILLGRK